MRDDTSNILTVVAPPGFGLGGEGVNYEGRGRERGTVEHFRKLILSKFNDNESIMKDAMNGPHISKDSITYEPRPMASPAGRRGGRVTPRLICVPPKIDRRTPQFVIFP